MARTQAATGTQGRLSTDTFVGDVFDNQSGTQRDVVLPASRDFVVLESLEIAAAFIVEIPATSTMEVLTYGSNKQQNDNTLYFANGMFDYIESGCLWTPDAPASTLNATMSPGFVWIAGKRLRVAAVLSRGFTASTDTYVDFYDNSDGTARVAYTETTNNAAAGSPALVGGLRNAIVVSGASNIAAQASINQGDPTCVLPIVSSITYAVTDSLGNLINPRDPSRQLLGYKEVRVTQSGIAAEADLTGLAAAVIVPAGRRIKITIDANYDATVADSSPFVSIKEGTTYINGRGTINANTPTGFKFTKVDATIMPTAGAHTYKAALQRFAGTGTISMAANPPAANTPGPAFIRIELDG